MKYQIELAIDALRAAQLQAHCTPQCYGKLNDMIHELREMKDAIHE